MHDLACVWTVPLAGTLRDLRAVVAIGKDTGDLEYAAYAAHAYVHNALYASRDLEPLLDEAIAFGAFMRAAGQTNALHVHEPFERLLAALTGRARDAARLDSDGFDEGAALDAARAAGSRSAQHILGLVTGVARYHFGSAGEASACLERARPFLDGVVSTWHTPMFHQYAALAIHALPEASRRDAPRRGRREPRRVEDVRRSLWRRELRAPRPPRRGGEPARRRRRRARAHVARSSASRWQTRAAGTQDVGLAHEIAARAHTATGDAAKAREALQAAARTYERWGARAKSAAILASLTPPGD